MKSFDERLIRDKLAENLSMIEGGLILCKKEFHLPPTIYGTRGYIDILAKDNNNNAVIIELKTRRSTTREAIHELIKYSESLQVQNNIRPSEMRLMLIATDWTEIIIPFSSFVAQTHLNLEGYQIIISESNEIEAIKEVIPIKMSTGRLFSESMLLIWCEDEETADQFNLSVIDIYKQKECCNYVVLKMIAPIEFEYNEKLVLKQILKSKLGLNDNILSKYISPHYCLCIITESYSKEDLLRMIENNTLTKELILKDGYENAKEVPIYYLHHKVFYSEFWYNHNPKVFLEHGEPAKLSTILNHNRWIIKNVTLGPVYEQNPFLTKEILLKELIGNDTTDRRKVYLEFNTDNRARFYYVRQVLNKSLEMNMYWRSPLLQVLDRIEERQIHISNGSINYFNPMSTLRYLYLYYKSNNSNSLEPGLIMLYDLFNSDEKRIEKIKYICIYEKKRKALPFKEILNKYYGNSGRVLRITSIFDGYKNNDLELIYDLGFECSVYKEIVLNYFPVQIDRNMYVAPKYGNEPPIYHKYDYNKSSFVECTDNIEILNLSYRRFIQDEPDFMADLLYYLNDTEESIIII